jgi:hypothetical protein
MKSQPCPGSRSVFSKVPLGYVTLVCLLVLCVGPARTEAQTFSSASDGSDGAYAPSGPAGTVVMFDPAQFSGTHVAANIFNFTTITIPVGITVKMTGNVINGPVIWLAQGDVNIGGTIDLSGGDGYNYNPNPFARVPSVPGPGGFAGGVGSLSSQLSLPGSGPGGGCVYCDYIFNYGTDLGGGGWFTGNQFLIPLIGGSGGGGGNSNGGGAGGGAILIASSTRIIVNGRINANGGNGGNMSYWGPVAGGGSGGAVRLVSNQISGSGSVTVAGGNARHGGGVGWVRFEAYTIALGGGSQSAPFPLLLPTVGPGTARVISIGGTAINPNPDVFPDITINTASPVPIVIQTRNVPTTATINLTILNENGVPDTVIPAPPLGNCDQFNVCTTTVNVVFPFGASRGLTKVTWTQ